MKQWTVLTGLVCLGIGASQVAQGAEGLSWDLAGQTVRYRIQTDIVSPQTSTSSTQRGRSAPGSSRASGDSDELSPVTACLREILAEDERERAEHGRL